MGSIYAGGPRLYTKASRRSQEAKRESGFPPWLLHQVPALRDCPDCSQYRTVSLEVLEEIGLFLP